MAKGMPEFRIPGADVAREIKDITDIGVKLLVNSPVENVAELKKDYEPFWSPSVPLWVRSSTICPAPTSAMYIPQYSC